MTASHKVPRARERRQHTSGHPMALALALLVAFGHVQTWHLIVFALWLGIVSAFDMPLRQSLYVHLVDDRADLPNAIALNSFLVNAARVVGPALAGVLLSLAGEAAC